MERTIYRLNNNELTKVLYYCKIKKTILNVKCLHPCCWSFFSPELKEYFLNFPINQAFMPFMIISGIGLNIGIMTWQILSSTIKRYSYVKRLAVVPINYKRP